MVSKNREDYNISSTIIIYKQLLKVEAAFRTLKQSLELRPVYHRKEDRIRAHVMLCWLALMLIRVVENQTGRTWREVREQLQRLHLVEYKSADGNVQQCTELTEEQLAIVSVIFHKEGGGFNVYKYSKLHSEIH
ncbi:transposase [Paenibacillus sp. GYB003]